MATCVRGVSASRKEPTMTDTECKNGSPTCTPNDPCVICYDAAATARMTFAATTANGIPMMFVWGPETRTVRYYDRRYAGQPGFTEHGQDCGPALCAESFQPDATAGIRGWHEVDAWDLDARTVRLVGMWLMISGFAHTALNPGN